jgi:hypothetical protein
MSQPDVHLLQLLSEMQQHLPPHTQYSAINWQKILELIAQVLPLIIAALFAQDNE